MSRRKSALPTRHHPLFGEIPLVPVQRTYDDGTVFHGFECDPDHAPPLPDGAVRGDVRRQTFCPMCHVPRYFFVDQEKRCVQCGDGFTFSAAEQKRWYERLRFHFDSTAIRCPACRRRQRSQKALQVQLASTRATLRERPEDPALLLSLAECTVRLHELTGHGKLDEAVAACRRARRLWPELRETWFWEGRAQARAGRREPALAAFRAFIDAAGKRARRLGALVDHARSYLES